MRYLCLSYHRPRSWCQYTIGLIHSTSGATLSVFTGWKAGRLLLRAFKPGCTQSAIASTVRLCGSLVERIKTHVAMMAPPVPSSLPNIQTHQADAHLRSCSDLGRIWPDFCFQARHYGPEGVCALDDGAQRVRQKHAGLHAGSCTGLPWENELCARRGQRTPRVE